MFRSHAEPSVEHVDTMPTPRKIPFEFGDDLEPRWHPKEPEFAAMVNGASLTMPFLEPFLIRSVRDAVEKLEDEDTKAYGRAFNTQEQYHYQTHRRYNELLKAKRYPQLEKVEDEMKASYKKLRERSLRTRMAYTAGFESMTLGVTKWLIGDRVKLLAGSDSRVASFVLWHMVEETEHKCVAYDVYMALYPRGLSNYLARVLGVFHGSLDVMRFSRRAYKIMLKRDGLWSSPRSRLRLAARLGRFMFNVMPFLLRACLPGHNPRQENDPQWVLDWLSAYDTHEDDYVPMVDTHHPQMPVPERPMSSAAGQAA